MRLRLFSWVGDTGRRECGRGRRQGFTMQLSHDVFQNIIGSNGKKPLNYNVLPMEPHLLNPSFKPRKTVSYRKPPSPPFLSTCFSLWK